MHDPSAAEGRWRAPWHWKFYSFQLQDMDALLFLVTSSLCQDWVIKSLVPEMPMRATGGERGIVADHISF